MSGIDHVPDDAEDRPEFVARRMLADLPAGAGRERFAFAFWTNEAGQIEIDYSWQSLSEMQIIAELTRLEVMLLADCGAPHPAIAGMLAHQIVVELRDQRMDAELERIVGEGGAS